MTPLFHPMSRLSIGLCGAVLFVAGMGTVSIPSANAKADVKVAGPSATSKYYGRWTVGDANAPFSVRGREYKTFDVAPCGKDFCGVSVNDKGQCGPVLFRFLSKSRNLETLKGHGKWGKAKKNVVMYTYDLEDGGPKRMMLYLGDGYDLGGRSGNMPKYDAEYLWSNKARCTART